MRRHIHLILFGLLVLLSSCSTTKFVPQDKYLLRKMRVKVETPQDDKRNKEKADEAKNKDRNGDYTSEALADKMAHYVRQKQNSEIFGFWPLQLQVYSSAGRDTTKWINRQMMKMGEAPEIFDPSLADASMVEIKKAMFNKGYFNALVDTTMRIKKQKLYPTLRQIHRLPQGL